MFIIKDTVYKYQGMHDFFSGICCHEQQKIRCLEGVAEREQ